MSDEPVPIEAGATTRRSMLAGAGVAGAAAVLAACGTDQGNDPYSDPLQETGAGTPSAPAVTPTPSTPAETPSTAPEEQEGQAQGLVPTEDVEVGGGVVLTDAEIVVTQPAEGEWRGFSAICTHQGCTVADVTDGTINCNCHGSKFSIEDGSVVNGPAPDPLPAQEVTVQDGQVVLA